MEKMEFQPHKGYAVQITRADGTTLSIADGDTYSTSDPDEVRELQSHPFVKPAEKAGK